MGKAQYKVEGGKLIKVELVRKGDKIEKIKITGDFFLYPEGLIEELEEALKGHLINESDLTTLVKTLVEKREATLLGASPEDFVKCVMMAGEKDG